MLNSEHDWISASLRTSHYWAWYYAKGRRWTMPLALGQHSEFKKQNEREVWEPRFKQSFWDFPIRPIREYSTEQPGEAARKLLKGTKPTTQWEHTGEIFSHQKPCQRPPRDHRQIFFFFCSIRVKKERFSEHCCFCINVLFPQATVSSKWMRSVLFLEVFCLVTQLSP